MDLHAGGTSVTAEPSAPDDGSSFAFGSSLPSSLSATKPFVFGASSAAGEGSAAQSQTVGATASEAPAPGGFPSLDDLGEQLKDVNPSAP